MGNFIKVIFYEVFYKCLEMKDESLTKIKIIVIEIEELFLTQMYLQLIIFCFLL